MSRWLALLVACVATLAHCGTNEAVALVLFASTFTQAVQFKDATLQDLKDQVDTWMRGYDADKDGFLSLSEFEAVMTSTNKRNGGPASPMTKEWMAISDANKDDLLDKDELVKMLELKQQMAGKVPKDET